jgi:hypothetical protein
MIFEDKMNLKAVDTELSGLSLIDSDVMEPKFKGEIHDTIKFLEDGVFKITDDIIVEAKAGETFEMPVGYNLVVDDCSRLIAALLKNHTGYTGIKFWEVGSGQSNWSDSAPPTPVSGDKTLNNPLFRKAVQTTDISFIDANSVVTTSVTNRIQVSVTFSSAEANGYLREFGLFGGGTDCVAGTLGSGVMVNRKTHGVIYKTSGMELQRTLRLTF